MSKELESTLDSLLNDEYQVLVFRAGGNKVMLSAKSWRMSGPTLAHGSTFADALDLLCKRIYQRPARKGDEE